MGEGRIGQGGSRSLEQEVESLRRRVAELEAAASTNPTDEQRVRRDLNLTPFDDAPLGLAYFGADLRYLYINRWLALRHGLSTAAHIGKRVAETLPEGAAGVEQQLRQVATTGQPVLSGTIRTETAVHPGVTRDYEHYYYPHADADGTLVGVSSVVLDVTGRKTDEQRKADDLVRGLVEAAPDALIAADRDGRVVLSNRQAEVLFGYAHGELAQLSVEQLMPGRFRTGHLGDRQRYVAAPVARLMGRRGDDLVGLRKNGEEFPAEISLAPLETDRGLLVITSIRDVGERRLLEAETRQQREELAHVTRVASLGELQSALAHELNQPLAATLSNAQAATLLLQQDPPDLNELRDTVSDIIADTRRAGAVIERVRTMMKTGRVARESVDLNALLGHIRDLTRSDFLIRDVTMRLERDPAMPRLEGDPIQIQQVVLNLVMNAAAAVVEREPEARTVTLSSQHDESNVTVSVRDSGHGIAETNRAKLFDPFYTTKREGLGMGLAVCRRLVESHGGRIWVVDSSSAGTTVRFTLPLDPGEEP